MTEFPYDEEHDPNSPTERAERLVSNLQQAIRDAIAHANAGDVQAARTAMVSAEGHLWAHKGNLADLLTAVGDAYDADNPRSGTLTDQGITT